MSENKDFDKASYRNKRGLRQRLTTAFKIFKYKIKAGKGIVIKSSVDFWLTDNAVLEIGDNCVIQDYAFFQLTKPHPKVILGKEVVIGRWNIISAKSLIKIGDYSRLGSYVQIIDCDHGFAKNELIMNQKSLIEDVIVGKDVWIGTGAKILKGVNIGDGAVIGANAVVTEDIPPYAIAVGVPARVVKYRT
jgi:acetyltransferase-like isoleucine patch superfamily enzyme